MNIYANIKTAYTLAVFFFWACFGGSMAWGQATAPTQPLIWDATSKVYEPKAGDTNGVITYSVTNTTETNITIRMVRPSCGCTVAKLPAIPWVIPAKGDSQMELLIDLRGKRGTLNKHIAVDTAVGFQVLTLQVKIPPVPGSKADARVQNQKLALADRQAVFKGTCIPCHVTTTQGKLGSDLYDAACGICHDAQPRASMVPGLAGKRSPQYRAYWYQWTAKGKEGTLMPGFEAALGGPLSENQIQSLVEFLIQPVKAAPPANPPQPKL